MSQPVPAADGCDAESIRAQLQRVLASDAFRNAPMLSRFLRYVVEQKISGPGAPLKEYAIGVDVFQRGAEFDPRVDTIVRVHGRRLRNRLGRYYDNEGRTDPVRIAIPKGHYQAEITAQVPAAATVASEAAKVVGLLRGTASWRQGFRSNTLAAPRTPLIGRAREVAELLAMLGDDVGPRLVTLTGTAGSGKTRLATEVGLRLQEQLPGDVAYIALASVADAQVLQLALLRALGLRADDNMPPIETVCRYLHGLERSPPLILDNFEQLAEAAPVIGAMLDACSSLKVLVTSRVALHLYGECEYSVAPLALPESDTLPPEQLAVVPAVALFVQRAAAVRPGFRLDTANAEAVARICRRFDGLPLGIELAAAQCRTLSPMQLLERFPERLDVPAGNVADVSDRQRSLRNAIEWSYDLLAPPERTLYRRLSVFAGGFTLEAAEAVADVGGDLGIDVATGVARLRDNNLLQATSDSDEPRYAMLETIREYGLEQLAASGERDAVGRAHAAYCLVLAEEGVGPIAGKARKDWLVRCDLEQDNFLAALDCLIECGDGQWALRLVRALYFYWERREHLTVACRVMLRVLQQFKPSTAPMLWAQVACFAAGVEGRLGRLEEGIARYKRSLEVARGCGDRSTEIMALNSIAVHYGFRRRYADAVNVYEECLRLCEASGSERETAAALSNLAVARLALGEHDEARGLMERALELFRKKKEWTPVAWCLNHLGDIAMVAGRYKEAEKHYRSSAKRFLKAGDVLGIARCWTDLGHLALLQAEYDRAASLFADALRINSRQGFQRGVASLIEGCAALEVARTHYRQGLTLAAAAEALRASRTMVAYPYQQVRLEEALRPAREALAAEQVEDCRRRGAAMDMREAIEYVQQCLAGSEPGESAAD